jgi:Uma2 family endonuclease
MRTAVKRFGPRDHGRRVTDEEAYSARYKEGYRYEIIDGRLYVSPVPNLRENRLDEWLREKLYAYKRRRPDVVTYISGKARVFVPDREFTTCPEPDAAVYLDFPVRQPIDEVRWEDVSPSIVAEVLSESDPFKDTFRNVNLYLEVPSIREYWILDGQEDPNQPLLVVRRRRADRWLKPQEIAYGQTYRTPLLPGFKLLIDPRR